MTVTDVMILQGVSFGIHSSQPFAAPAHTCARSSPLPQPQLSWMATAMCLACALPGDF